MRINVRLLLITFSVVALVLASSTVVYYSLSNKIILSRENKALLQSANQFIFSMQESIAEVDLEFRTKFSPEQPLNLQNSKIDFVFTLQNDSLIYPENFHSKQIILENNQIVSIREFFEANPNIILRYHRGRNGNMFYYGKILSPTFLNKLALKINAEVALIINNSPVEFSNPNKNGDYLLNLIDAVAELRFKNNFDIFYDELEKEDFFATIYRPRTLSQMKENEFSLLIFKVTVEGYEFRATQRFVLIILLLSGIALTGIFVLLFTTKFRQQISLLTSGAEEILKGNLEHRVKIVSKDEIGKLGRTFNSMVNMLLLKERAEKEYADFITLINQNPTLKELSDAALDKIIKTTGLDFGILYLIEDDSIHKISAYGISDDSNRENQNIDLYKSVIEKKEPLEFSFKNNFPQIKTGLASITIKYLSVTPILNNNKVLAVLELASVSKPKADVKEYIASINEQLGTGLANAAILDKLENLVDELKKLNEDYQKQNIQIKEQNQELVDLHKEIKKKAEELNEQKEKAIGLTKSKSEFLATMSHELKTPLNSILGLGELVFHDESTLPKTKDRVTIILRNGKKLLNLISNILDFSKLDSGKLEVNKSNFLLNDLISEIDSYVQPLFFGKQIKFSIDFNIHEDLLINTDKIKLEQILNNLISNAVKFTEEGEVKLQVFPSGENDVHFEVHDTGIGISEKDLKNIFNDFEQASETATKRIGGAGLGLSIADKYSKLLGGSISAISKLGKGSVFTLALPNVIFERVPISPAVEKSSSKKEPKSKKSREKENRHQKDSKDILVMIVDDDADTLFTVGEIISNLGYQTLFAKNGKDCLSKLKNASPDLILLDIMMPELNGFKTVEHIRKDSKLQSIPVIALTAYAMIDDKDVITNSGFDDLITKPINNSALISQVEKALIKSNSK